MINPILFGILCLLIIVTVAMMSLYAIENDRLNQTQTYPSGWCRGDWKCGTGSSITSPVLDMLPVMYGCRIENFTLEASNTCVCPIGFARDWELDAVPSSSTYGQVVAKPGATIDLFVCDNVANLNPALAPGGADDISDPTKLQGPLSACDITTCKALWSTPQFTSRPAGFGKLTTLPPTAQWKVKTGKVRMAPNGWDDLSSITTMPVYSSSILYAQ